MSETKQAVCEDCGVPYPFGIDLILPREQWNHIMPGREDGGLLCGTCICRRADKLKSSTVILAWIDRIDWAAPRPSEWFESNKKENE